MYVDCILLQITMESHKSYQKFKIGTPIKTKDELTFRIRDNPDDIINPVKMFELFRSYCPPEQVRLFCRYQTTKLEHNRRTNMVDGKVVPILYKSMPKCVMGENTIGEKTRELAKICGWENWESCTNHGLRALGVTILHNCKEINLTNKPVLNHCRHAGPTSQIPYNRESDIANSALQNALIGDVKPEILSIAPVDTELSVLKGHIVELKKENDRHIEELKKENDLLRNQLKHKNQCIIM